MICGPVLWDKYWMNPPNLSELYNRAWSYLVAGVKGQSTARLVVLASVDPSGQPEARSVVLRSADPAQSRLEFHTDVDSQKVTSLHHMPRAQIHVWDPTDHVQLRLDVQVALRQDDYASEQWKKVPGPSQIAYGKTPSTGRVIPGPFAYETTSSQENFVVADCLVRTIDYLCLDGPHFRAVFKASDGWKGAWLSP